MKYLNSRKCLIILAVVIGILITFITSHNSKSSTYSDIDIIRESISEKIIRFHVLANSDSDEDQALKMKVKENVVNYTRTLLSDSESVDETKVLLSEHNEEILDIARNTIKSEGYNYTVTASLENVYFPTKSYGDITLPCGDYEAYRILIGEAEGKNWWCVLYPPLCFVDASHGVLPADSKELLKNMLDEDEYSAITSPDYDEDSVTFRFKFLTFLNSIFE